MDENKIKSLIIDKLPHLERKNYVRHIVEYVNYLQKNQGQDELILFCIEELLKPVVYEFLIGKEIYSVEDFISFFQKNKSIVERELLREILSSRTGVDLNRFNRNIQKAWDSLDISFEILRSQEIESFDVFQSWIEKALEDLESSKILLKKKKYLNSLNKLQLGVEGLIKSYALYVGLKKEEQLKNTGHFSVNIYIDLLKNSWVYKARDIFELDTNIDECRTFLEKTKIPRVKSSNISNEYIDELKNELLTWDETTVFFIKNSKKVNHLVEKAFSEKDTRLCVSICNRLLRTDIKSYYIAWFGFTTLLLPLSIITQFYQSTYTYPVYSRKLKKIYKNSNLVQNMDEIISLLKQNVGTLKKTYPLKRELSYTYLGETLQHKLINLNNVSDSEKLKEIKENLDVIKNDEYITALINKIKNNDLSKLVEKHLESYFKNDQEFIKNLQNSVY